MTMQVINIGATSNDGMGDNLRVAFTKINTNFQVVQSSIPQTWVDTENNKTHSVVSWTSGKTVSIDVSPFETYTATAYSSETDSSTVMCKWDQTFIDEVWEGNGVYMDEGSTYSVSFDNGTTWYAVERNGYNGGSHFYFSVPYEHLSDYSFTYAADQTFLIRYNRGSLPVVWFDLAESGVPIQTILAVQLSVTVQVAANNKTATRLYSDAILLPGTTTTSDDETVYGSLITGQYGSSGDELTGYLIDCMQKRSALSTDAGKIYCRHSDGIPGVDTFFWTAKIYTVTTP